MLVKCPASSQMVNSVSAEACSWVPGRGQTPHRSSFSLAWIHIGIHEWWKNGDDGSVVEFSVSSLDDYLGKTTDCHHRERCKHLLCKHNLSVNIIYLWTVVFSEFLIRMKSFELSVPSVELVHTPCSLWPEKGYREHTWGRRNSSSLQHCVLNTVPCPPSQLNSGRP